MGGFILVRMLDGIIKLLLVSMILFWVLVVLPMATIVARSLRLDVTPVILLRRRRLVRRQRSRDVQPRL